MAHNRVQQLLADVVAALADRLHVRRDRWFALQCGWSRRVDQRRGLTADGADTALVRSVKHSCHPSPSNLWGGSLPDIESRQL